MESEKKQDIKKNNLAEKLATYIFYFSVLLFLTAFNFQDKMTGGWYQQFLPNMGGKQITDITFLDSLTGYAVARQTSDSSYILKTTNGGDNWLIIYRNFYAMTGIKFLDINTGFACGAYLYKTTNGGFNWNQVNAPSISPEYLAVMDENSIWIISSESLTGGVFRTTNGGLNWTQQFSGLTENPNNIYMYNARIGFIAKNSFPRYNNLRKTTNGGLNWNSVNNDGFISMYFIDSLNGWKSTGGDDDSTMKKTTNGGLNWIKLNLSHGSYNISGGIIRFSNINRDTLWGVGSYILFPNNHIFPILWKTTNSGNNWAIQVPDTSVIHLSASYSYINFINKSLGWAYYFDRGIHTIVGGDTTFLSSVHQISSKVPNEYQLFQNYPNPFNPSTNIKYQISNNKYITIKIYDINGREIVTLVNRKQNAGIYVVEFDGNNLSSGIYLYTLYVDGVRIDTKKAILLK